MRTESQLRMRFAEGRRGGAGGGRGRGGSSSRRGRARLIARARGTTAGGPCTSRGGRARRSPRSDRRACSRSCSDHSRRPTRWRFAWSISRCRAITCTSSSKATTCALWSGGSRVWRPAAPRPSIERSDATGTCGSAAITLAPSARPRRSGARSSTFLLNFRKRLRAGPGVDPRSSGPWFAGWRRDERGHDEAGIDLAAPRGASPVAAPRTWLGTVGWRRAGGAIALDERPGAARARSRGARRQQGPPIN